MLEARGQLFVGNLHLAQEDLARVERDAAQRGVGNGPRLLPDFLEHEVLVAALFRLDRIPLNARELALDGLAVKVGELDACRRQDGHVAVGQEVDVARVVQNAGHVGGDKALAFAHADNDRRAEPRGNNLVGLGGRQHAQRKRAREPLDRRRTATSSGTGLPAASASFWICSIRCAMISVSVSVTNLCPWAASSRFNSR